MDHDDDFSEFALCTRGRGRRRPVASRGGVVAVQPLGKVAVRRRAARARPDEAAGLAGGAGIAPPIHADAAAWCAASVVPLQVDRGSPQGQTSVLRRAGGAARGAQEAWQIARRATRGRVIACHLTLLGWLRPLGKAKLTTAARAYALKTWSWPLRRPTMQPRPLRSATGGRDGE